MRLNQILRVAELGDADSIAAVPPVARSGTGVRLRSLAIDEGVPPSALDEARLCAAESRTSSRLRRS